MTLKSSWFSLFHFSRAVSRLRVTHRRAESWLLAALKSVPGPRGRLLMPEENTDGIFSCCANIVRRLLREKMSSSRRNTWDSPPIDRS